MIKTIFTSAAAAALLAASPAFAKAAPGEQASDTASTSASDAGKDKAERKTCRTFQNTVSRVKSEKLCLTREGWRKFEAAQ